MTPQINNLARDLATAWAELGLRSHSSEALQLSGHAGYRIVGEADQSVDPKALEKALAEVAGKSGMQTRNGNNGVGTWQLNFLGKAWRRKPILVAQSLDPSRTQVSVIIKDTRPLQRRKRAYQ